MRIDTIRVLRIPVPRFGAHTLVQIVADDGSCGIGQSGAWGHPAAAAAVLDRLAPLLRGADPRDVELLTTAARRALPFRGNLLAAAVSAVDMALWDLRGRIFEQPVWQLLGGRARRRARAHLIVRAASPDQLATAVGAAVASGYDAVKIDPLDGTDDEPTVGARLAGMRERADAARSAADGADLIFDLHRRLTPAEAPRFCAALAPYEPLYIEDPLQIDTIDQQADLAGRVETPLAVGERLSSLSEFRELLSHQGALVMRPDLGIAGGVTGGRKIAALAEAHHTVLSPHNFLGPLITAATVHLATSIPNLLTLEYDALDESADWLRTGVRREGGHLVAGDEPGLGVELATDAVDGTEPPLTLEALLDADGAARHPI